MSGRKGVQGAVERAGFACRERVCAPCVRADDFVYGSSRASAARACERCGRPTVTTSIVEQGLPLLAGERFKLRARPFSGQGGGRRLPLQVSS